MMTLIHAYPDTDNDGTSPYVTMEQPTNTVQWDVIGANETCTVHIRPRTIIEHGSVQASIEDSISTPSNYNIPSGMVAMGWSFG